jgi:hypothetical protein
LTKKSTISQNLFFFVFLVNRQWIDDCGENFGLLDFGLTLVKVDRKVKLLTKINICSKMSRLVPFFCRIKCDGLE